MTENERLIDTLKREEKEPSLKAFYIVFEGIDGCGKTTQIDHAHQRLSQTLNTDVVRLREPTRESVYGKYIRDAFSRGERPSYDDEVDLFAEDRKWNMRHRVSHAMQLDVVILQDRSYFSTAAYQGCSGKYSYHDLIQMHETFSISPHLVLLFDMDVRKAQERIGSRGEGDNAMERLDVQIKVRDTFLKIYRDYGESRNIILIDANRKKEIILDEIMDIICRHLGKHRWK